jgi:cytochrome P450
MSENLPLHYVHVSGGSFAEVLVLDDALLIAFDDDMHAALRAASQAGPIARHPETGVVLVLRHADVDALGRDPRLIGVGTGNFDAVGITDGPLREWFGSLMFTNEGEYHLRLRRLVQKAFTPRAVDAIRDTARTMADESFAAMRADGGGDLVAAARTLPLRVICRLIGVPDADVEINASWADALSATFGFLTPDQAAAATSALGRLNDYVEGLLAARRDAPTDDLVSALVLAEVEGDRLTHDEARTMVGNLIVGGHDTTGSQIGCSFLALLRNTDEAAPLAGRPELVAHAVEETMRFEPSISAIPRTPTEDLEVSGVRLGAGSMILLSTAAANREPGVWDEPDRFWLARFAQPGVPRLMSFGVGTHYCLGAALARMTLEEAVRSVFADGPQPTPAFDVDDVEWRQVLGRSPVSLPVAFGG